MKKRPLYLAFIWHMHQPYYKEPLKGEYLLPWVRLHGYKDYYEMIQNLEDFPRIHCNFNLVPSLLVQINDYIYGQAQDIHLRLSTIAAEELREEEKKEILDTFFMGYIETMINPYPRYRELFDKRNRGETYNVQDFLDLQVWSNLSWFSHIFKGRDSFIHALLVKGRDYNEEEKRRLLAKGKWILLKIIPGYKRLQDEGQIEISISPYYHPILPLLVDPTCARFGEPDLVLPQNPLKAEEDARVQIRRAVRFYHRRFGRRPRGMWPSEGAISNEVIPLIAEEGLFWLASCEGILGKSLGRGISGQDLYRPYRLDIDGANISIVFRDRTLSDLISFSYSKWRAEDGVSDLVNRLHRIKAGLPDSEDHLVTIIMDGENAWEYYQNDGYDFLSLLYSTLSKERWLKTVTISEYLEGHPPTVSIKDLYPGSWINHNLRIWVGHREDNLAWDYLYKARERLTGFTRKQRGKKEFKEGIEKAWDELYVAEGSDWFWWFGEDHSSGEDAIFDMLFREHLASVYRFIGQTPPAYLSRPIKKTGRSGSPYSTMARGEGC